MQNNGNGGNEQNRDRYVRPSAPVNPSGGQQAPAYPRRTPGQANASREQVEKLLQQQYAPRPARQPEPQKQARPAQPQARPVQGQARPVQGQARPAQAQARPVQPQTRPVQGQPAQPVQQQKPSGQISVKTGRSTLTVKPRFFVFCAVVLALIIGLFAGAGALLNALLAGDAVISYGRIEDVTTVDALIIRNETSVRAEGYGSLEYLVPEMSYVTPDTPVVQVYATGYSGEKIEELDKLMVDITQQKKKVLGDIMNVTITDYNNSVTTQVNSITAAMREEPGQLQGMFDQLGALMKARQDYIEKTTEAKEDPKKSLGGYTDKKGIDSHASYVV